MAAESSLGFLGIVPYNRIGTWRREWCGCGDQYTVGGLEWRSNLKGKGRDVVFRLGWFATLSC